MSEYQRRLAAIVAADVAGYSRLIGADEEATLKTLRAYKAEVILPHVETHGGRVANTAGDSLLIEFPSAVEAVRSAVAVQNLLADRNRELPEDRRIDFRVGIHIGDVVADGEDMLGDGVNVAARLEALADPGGIVISENVHESIDGKIWENFVDDGAQTLKNIARPVRAWRWNPNSGLPDAVSDLAERPSIVVLPFDNLSADDGDAYFADGISEDITTILSRFRHLNVVSRNSAFTFKGRAVEAGEIGRALNSRYVFGRQRPARRESLPDFGSTDRRHRRPAHLGGTL